MSVITWFLGELNVKENAPRWAGLAVAAFTGWLTSTGVVDLDAEAQASLIVVVTVVITTVVQKIATLPR